MNKKSIYKIILDITMIISFILLLFPNFTGILLHEALGIISAFFVITHLIFNFGWIKNSLKKFVAETSDFNYKLKFVINFSLLIMILLSIISGICVSNIFPVLNINIMHSLHSFSSYASLVIILLHSLMHAKYMFKVTKKAFSNFKTLKPVLARMYTLSFVALLIVFLFLDNTTKTQSAIVSSNNTINNTPSISSDLKDDDDIYYSDIPSSDDDNYYSDVPSSDNEDNTTIYESSDDNDNDTQINESSGETVTEKPTLVDFLNKLNCNICPRHCSLAAPQCGKSRNLISEATAEYNETYS